MVAGIAVASLVASPFIGVVVNKLGAEFFEEWGLCRSVKADVRRLQSGLSKLRSLDFGGYVASPSAFDGLQNLTVLELLRIGSCDELTCMPESLMQHHIPSFQSLKLINNSNLKSLGEGRDQQPPSLFTSLCHLEIEASHSLTALPEWIRYLPLQNLKIRGCSQLEGRCQRETGEDWHKIAHIPCVTIESTIFLLN
ncbi:hypothetical protein C4D60_Mb07t16500 [Musa balbisiana]|uniref:Rx N-terminal domain-containing protein n=1 Tax=Musa balbisiana TaxID=52838 RepID=A0A4S8JGG9_MUSBA|nr:hypothetical protein C4D60_Mb07t16500 [Musa balbisiana]